MKKLLLLSMFGLFTLTSAAHGADGAVKVDTSGGVTCVFTQKDPRKNAAIYKASRKKGLTEGTLAALCSLVTGTGYIVDNTLYYGASWGLSGLAFVGSLVSNSSKYCFSSKNAQAALGLIVILTLIEGADRYNLLPETVDSLWDITKSHLTTLGLNLKDLYAKKPQTRAEFLDFFKKNIIVAITQLLAILTPKAASGPTNWTSYFSSFFFQKTN